MGLSYFTSADVALFGGRESEVRSCARLIAPERTKVLLLQGTTGCGKSSFLRAGLIPYLESEVERFQFLKEFDATKVKALFIRCTDAPLARVSECLYDWSGKSFHIDLPDFGAEDLPMTEIREGRDRAAFIKNHTTSIHNLIGTLSAIEVRLPKTVVLVIDQGEEVLTLNNDKDERDNGDQDKREHNRRSFFDFLVEFSKATIDLKIIIALRKEFFGDFYEELSKRHFDSEHLAFFLLPELSNQKLIDVVGYPTSCEIPPKYLQGRPQPGEYYNFGFKPDLPATIVSRLRSVKVEGGILPVLQITCERLYAKANAARERTWANSLWFSRIQPQKDHLTITYTDLDNLGDLGEQVDFYVHDVISTEVKRQRPELTEAPHEEEVALWKDVLYTMVRVQSDNTAVSRIRSEEELKEAAKKSGCIANFEQMATVLSSEENRVLREDSRNVGQVSWQEGASNKPIEERSISVRAEAHSDKDRYFSLGHDAIAVALSKWKATRQLDLRGRTLSNRVGHLTRALVSNSALISSSIVLTLIGAWYLNKGLQTSSYTFGAYFAFVTMLAIGAASFLFGVLGTVAELTATLFKRSFALFWSAFVGAVVFATGYWLVTTTVSDFDLAIRLQGSSIPLEDIAKNANVVLDVDDTRRRLSLSPLAEAQLKLPYRFRKSTVGVSLESTEYHIVDPKGAYPIPSNAVISLNVEKKPSKFERTSTVGDLVRVTSGGTSDGKSPFCQSRSVEGCITPQRRGGRFILGSGAAADVTQTGRTGWRVTKNTSEQICVEFWASTGACETQVSIQGRPSAVEEYPVP